MNADVVVVGAGMVGVSCAFHCAAAGLRVAVVDRGPAGGGTTSACEGNILLSDKEPGPELDLALLSARLWQATADEVGADRIEYQRKGGVVVATTDAARAGLGALTAAQRAAGVDAADVDADRLRELEPNLTPAAVGGAHHPQDAQVQPMLASARMLAHVRARGTRFVQGAEVTGFLHRPDGSLRGVTTTAGALHATWVVNAAGSWSGSLAAQAGAPVDIRPRKGFVLVTAPMPRVVRHKVYTADYVANVASGDAGLETSVVVEGTRAGTVLIGASRERVGFDRSISVPVLARLARQAIEVFPFLRDVALLRTYLGFRPYCPDHLPVIGPDPRVPGLVHATGHEGAGIGLSAATGRLVAQALTGETSDVDLAPFRPDRFAQEVAA